MRWKARHWLCVPKVRQNVFVMRILEIAKQYKEGAETISEWLGSGGETVSQNQAQDRAGVCIHCPQNVSDFIPTKLVALAIKKQLELKSKLELRVVGEKSLHTCCGCSCVLRLKIWIPLKNLGVTESELDNFVPQCWMRKEFAEQQNRKEQNELYDKA